MRKPLDQKDKTSMRFPFLPPYRLNPSEVVATPGGLLSVAPDAMTLPMLFTEAQSLSRRPLEGQLHVSAVTGESTALLAYDLSDNVGLRDVMRDARSRVGRVESLLLSVS